MPFESLSERHTFSIHGFPEEWLPLTYLYDPDLPLFPLQYFHLLDPSLPTGMRAGEKDRAFGFVHHVNFSGDVLEVTIALNKNLAESRNAHLRVAVEQEVRSRLGLGDPIKLSDLSGKLTGILASANRIVDELWYQVIDRQFGQSLPFGRMWDGVFGLVRFIASWNSEGGRKGELIQTHYFATAFGERIATGSGIHVDFYLLPTFEELTDTSNPLSLFPTFAALISAAKEFVAKFCTPRAVGNQTFSSFSPRAGGYTGQFNTKAVLGIINGFSGRQKDALFENYNAFNRGPHRSVISLLMLHDIRNGNWNPKALTPDLCAAMYKLLDSSYQTPKVIQLYAQQCFASECALPIDNWVATFLKWPFSFRPPSRTQYFAELFACSAVWGKLERLIWMASQARKVHSLAAAEILWCVRFGGPERQMRGANPLACKACAVHIRNACPAYAAIKGSVVHFNSANIPVGGYRLITSQGSSTAPGQTFVSCEGPDSYDEYTPRDRSQAFQTYPMPGHGDTPITVEQFISQY